MKNDRHLSVITSILILWWALALSVPALGETDADQPWQRLYKGEQATGPNVIALWQFLPGQEAKDNSGNGHDLTLRSQSRFVAGGRLGSCLESFRAELKNDKPNGAMAKNHPSLSPQGAFTLELWFKPKPEMSEHSTVFLLDKKYFHYAKDEPRANWDYCLYLRRVGQDRHRIVAYLGYGTDSVDYSSQEVDIEPGVWYHVAFTYDGAGTGRFFLNGKSVGRVIHENRGPVTPGKYHLVIGDRYGSNYNGFPGYIDQVRICGEVVPFFTGNLEADVANTRTAFVRMEPKACVTVTIVNDTRKTVAETTVRTTFAGRQQSLSLGSLAPKETRRVEVPIETSLRPDTYPLQVVARADAGGKEHRAQQELSVVIVPRPLPHQMPVVMWGSGDFERLHEIGFTHKLVHLADCDHIWEAGAPTDAGTSGRVAEMVRRLDEHLVQNIGAVATISPGRWAVRNARLKDQVQRLNRAGKPYERENACALAPKLQNFAYNVGASIAKSYGNLPALQAALIHTEVRDGTNLCFHPYDREAFRKFAGVDIPDAAVSKAGVQYDKLKDFPADRIIPDDHRLLTFYRWFWKDGDGWNPLHRQVHRGLKSTGRDDLWTFFDPAVRAPSLWGSGAGLDVISQWTYSYPDPIKIGQTTDEMFAMAAGAPANQKVMKMTQIIWYRSQTAPKIPEDESKRAAWEKEIPDARFITIAPDHLREAFWSKISRPITGIMYHGWGSLVEATGGGYRFTNPETAKVLAELTRQVVTPLGPTLLQVPDRPSDVALLESFTSQMFARRGTRGWGRGWEADMHLVLQWAQLQPKVVYDETILRDGLKDIRVLVMPCCDVLTQGVARRVAEFQKRGGLIVADEHLAPALKPDILLPSYRRSGKADEDKAALQDKASQLRRQLDGRYRRYGDSSTPDVIVRFRQSGTTDYLFAVNDKRTFGTYVGHHGKVMEKGLPTSATLSVARQGGYVYDLVSHQAVPAKGSKGALSLEASFAPGAGRLFMIADRKIADLRLQAPTTCQLGEKLELKIAVVDDDGKPLGAVVPIHVEVLDPQGRPAESTGYYGAQGGQLSIALDLASNDLPGQWAVRACELASGLTSRSDVTVQKATFAESQ